MKRNPKRIPSPDIRPLELDQRGKVTGGVLERDDQLRDAVVSRPILR